jgi:Homeodomain
MTSTATLPGVSDSNLRCSLSEALEELAAASQRVADLAAEAAGLDVQAGLAATADEETCSFEVARQTLVTIFDAAGIEGYDGSESMENARVAHFDAALEMYKVMAEDEMAVDEMAVESDHASDTAQADLASRIGHALLRELIDYYRTTLHGNDRVTFTTEQRNALESAFLLKPKLNTAEKRALARTCNLNPRQVEVWVCARLFVRLILPIVFKPAYPKETGRKTYCPASSGKKWRVAGQEPFRKHPTSESKKGLSAPAFEQRRKRELRKDHSVVTLRPDIFKYLVNLDMKSGKRV